MKNARTVLVVRRKKMVAVERKQFNEWSSDIQDKLKRLTNVKEGVTSGMLSCIEEEKWEDITTYVAFYNEQPVGWLMSISFFSDNEKDVMVYVDPNYRRLKIGSKLVELHSKDTTMRSTVFVWNDCSYNFYKSLAAKSGLRALDTRNIEDINEAPTIIFT